RPEEGKAAVPSPPRRGKLLHLRVSMVAILGHQPQRRHLQATGGESILCRQLRKRSLVSQPQKHTLLDKRTKHESVPTVRPSCYQTRAKPEVKPEIRDGASRPLLQGGAAGVEFRRLGSRGLTTTAESHRVIV